MRGTGFRCDHCRATAVDAADVLPAGWVQTVQRAHNPFGDDHEQVTFHFCGWRCAERYAESAQPERVS